MLCKQLRVPLKISEITINTLPIKGPMSYGRSNN
jgi:hypothetical protein